MADVASSYNEHFEVVRADTPQQLDLAYRLRYQVYCVENPFEDPARCPDGREIDEDDHRSVHTLLIHRRSGVAAGTSRLIMPRLDDEGPLPIQRIVGWRKLKSVHRVPLHRIAEISRFAVSKDFRRRCGEARYPDAGFPYPPSASDMAARRLFPHITFGLLGGILGICLEYDIAVLAAVMEPALLRILTRLGLNFEPIGSLVEYHGLRQPCVARVAKLIECSRDQGSALWNYLETSGCTARLGARKTESRTDLSNSAGGSAFSSAHGFP
jgi:N-acyl amino acid synthase of PEP-CTERM/exosortase system